jgi:protein-histidine pros-kinase
MHRYAEATFEKLLESAPDAIVGVGTDGRITLVNAQTERLFGYSRDELIGQPVEMLVPQAAGRVHLAHRASYFANPVTRPMGAARDLAARRKDGSEFPAEISLGAIETGNGLLVSAAVRDVSERRRAETALREREEDLRKANQAKSEYLSRMSHELRTPLNAILGFAQLLKLDQLRDDQHDSLRHILAAAEHLLALVNEVLDIAAIEAGRLPLSLEPVAIADLLGEVVDLVRPLADDHSVLLHPIPVGRCAAYVRADQQRLKQILFNLLSNAVKYNRQGGSVHVSCDEVTGERLRVTVTDTGPGITTAALHRLFVPFERIGSEQIPVEGSGLGLPVSKRLAEAMGATLEVATEVGRGSSFWVELPLAETPAAADEQPEQAGPPPGQDQDAAARPPLTVLYIEDNLSNLQLVDRILSRRPDVELISAMRPELGLELAGEHHPDLVLLDLHLPDMPGEEVFRRLRAAPETAAIPVAILSADARPSLIARLLDQGAQAFLTKPLDVGKLLGLLDAIAAERAG